MMPDVPRGTSPTSERSDFSEATSQNLDFSTWLTKQQAADAIGVSTKTIEQFAKDGKIQQAVWRPQNRGAAKAVYQPDDVARIASERRPGLAAFVLPAVTASNGNGHGQRTGISPISPIAPTPTGEEILRLVFTAALQRLTSENPPASENLSEKWWLTIPEAAAVSGLSQANLRRRCQSGWPGAIKDGAWKIRRRDLEAL
jgi:hypothetical protein